MHLTNDLQHDLSDDFAQSPSFKSVTPHFGHNLVLNPSCDQARRQRYEPQVAHRDSGFATITYPLLTLEKVNRVGIQAMWTSQPTCA